MLTNVKDYFLDHWRGKQGLGWSFWVNLVAVRLAIFAVQEFAVPAKGQDYHDWTWLVLLLVFIFHGLLLVWQIVGVLRAGEFHFRDRGVQAPVWGAQLACVALLFLTGSYALQAFQTTHDIPEEENFIIRMEREHRSKYELIVSKARSTLTIDGLIELGITKNVRQLVENTPGLNLVILKSDGGNIYEARGLAKLFTDHTLHTRVDEYCSSACTSAFVGGSKRTIYANAKLGFHQYRIDANYDVIVANPAQEQKKDQQLYLSKGVKSWFTDKMFQSSSNDMWFPDNEELLRAGVVHEIVN